MFNSILFISALPHDYIDYYINNLDKCTLSWTIKKTEILKYHDCFDKVNIFIKNDLWYYKVNTSLNTEIQCDDNSIEIYNINNLPKNWEKIDFLIDKTDKYIISNNKKLDSSYILSTWTIIRENNICEPNSNFVEFHKEYLYYWIIICFLIIIWIVINMIRWKK